MQKLEIDRDYMVKTLAELLATPSPSGMTDVIVGKLCRELEALGIDYELTRRGAIRADLPGKESSPDRAIVSHLDTLGAMVKRIKENGRLEIVPIGHWSSRFAEGARASLYLDDGSHLRGTILPLKASGHVYADAIDTQKTAWGMVEFRIDEKTACAEETAALGVHVGDTLAIDPQPEFLDNGFVCSRHLDDKAGVAAVLAAAKAVLKNGTKLPIDCHLLFTISEEVGVGASHVLHGDVAEMVSIDNGTIAPGQNTSPFGVTISMQDMTGPFDWHLTRRLIGLCKKHGIEHSRDVFKYYRSDAAAALEAGNDIRTALLCFGLDASHGYERTHLDSLECLACLLALYMQSPPIFKGDREALGTRDDLPFERMR